MMKTDEDLEKSIEDAMDIVEKVLMKPDVPSSQIYEVLNQLGAYASFVRMGAAKKLAEGDRKGAEVLKQSAQAIETVIGTLKFQAKQQIENKRNY